MRVIVCGSRTWTDASRIRDLLDLLTGSFYLEAGESLTVVHGAHHEGADAIVAEWCEAPACGQENVIAEPHPADWSQGLKAGPLRNREMAEAGADFCIAFRMPGKSNGTDSMIHEAEAAGIPVEVVHGR